MLKSCSDCKYYEGKLCDGSFNCCGWFKDEEDYRCWVKNLRFLCATIPLRAGGIYREYKCEKCPQKARCIMENAGRIKYPHLDPSVPFNEQELEELPNPFAPVDFVSDRTRWTKPSPPKPKPPKQPILPKPKLIGEYSISDLHPPLVRIERSSGDRSKAIIDFGNDRINIDLDSDEMG